MNILITNIWLSNHAGTEVGVRDLAIALSKQGIHVEVYSNEMGAVAEEIRKAGIHVADSTEDLVMKPDLIHAQHFLPTMDAIMRFPDVPAIYFLHDRMHPADTPPKYSQIARYVAVDYNCLDRLIIDNRIDEKNTTVIYNWVDTDRYKLRQIISEKPSKALVFSNYAKKDNYSGIIKEACSKLEIELDGLGTGFGNAIYDPENILHNYDLVFAKAKAAMEALATGAGVILCDTRGLGEFVTLKNFDHFRKYNFGMKTLTRPIEVDLLIKEIEKYDREEILMAAGKIRDDASFKLYTDNILRLYQKTIDEYSHKKASQEDYQDKVTIQKYLEQKEISARKEMDKLKQIVATINNPTQGHPELTINKNKTVETEKDVVRSLIAELNKIKNSWSYKLGRFLTAPARYIYELFR